MRRSLTTVAWFVIAAAALTACRGDEPMPDVFLDELHCGRAPDAEPLPICDAAMAQDSAMDGGMDAAVE
jgi:hypothetical protein